MGLVKSTWNVAVKQIKYYPCHPRSVPRLYEGDWEDQMTMARLILNDIEDNPDALLNYLWTDECLFSLDPQINIHNWIRYGP